MTSNPYLLSSYHVTSPSSFQKKDPLCLATYWVQQSVSYRRLTNWDRTFCLVGFPQNCDSIIVQPMRARPTLVATSHVSLVVFSKLRRGFKLKDYFESSYLRVSFESMLRIGLSLESMLPFVIKFCLFHAGNLYLRLSLGTQSN
jgi:hypothetical protein